MWLDVIQPYSKVLSKINVIISANGTASSIPTNPITNAPITILIKITTGFTPSVLFITTGIRILFSVRCMSKNNPIIKNPPPRP